MLDQQYTVFGRDIVSENFDGDVVVLDLGSGKYFSFTDTGCLLWEALTAGLTARSLAGKNPKVTEAGLTAFISELSEHKLITVRNQPVDAVVSAELLAKLAAGKEAPGLFVFDDLADLFLADPIHDVEETAGWPVMREPA